MIGLRSRRPGRGERGSAPVEVAAIAPAVLILLMLVLYAGRVTRTSGEVQSAASAAARAASQEATVGFADQQADVVAQQNLDDADIECTTSSVGILADRTDMAPGGQVTVEVSCTVSNADLTLLAVPSERTFTATATEVIDTYRGGGP